MLDGTGILCFLSLVLLSSLLCLFFLVETPSQPAPVDAVDAQTMSSNMPTLPERRVPEEREVLAIAAPVRTAAPVASGLVRIHGRVLRGTRPVPEFDLVFQPLGRGPEFGEQEWDYTDKKGHYEVELLPATYAVLNDDDGPCLTYVVVAPTGKDEIRLDIDLR